MQYLLWGNHHKISISDGILNTILSVFRSFFGRIVSSPQFEFEIYWSLAACTQQKRSNQVGSLEFWVVSLQFLHFVLP